MNAYRFSDLKLGMTEEFCTAAVRRGGAVVHNSETIACGHAGGQTDYPLEISRESLDLFRDLTGDISPIHTDGDYARERGFAGRVCYGMLTSAFYSTLVGVYLPGKYALFQEAHISMAKPVYIGDRLSVTGKITELNEALKRITIKARIRNQKGETVSRATLAVGVSE